MTAPCRRRICKEEHPSGVHQDVLYVIFATYAVEGIWATQRKPYALWTLFRLHDAGRTPGRILYDDAGPRHGCGRQDPEKTRPRVLSARMGLLNCSFARETWL